MNNETLLLFKKDTVSLVEQTKSRPQETLELKMNEQMKRFSFNPPIIFSEEGKWLLGVTYFEYTNSVFNITNENNSFSIIVPGCWRIPNYLKDGIIDKLRNLPNLRSQNNIELHAEDVRKRGKQTKLEIRNANFQTLIFLKKLFEGLNGANNHELEDLVYRMELTYDEIMDVLDIKQFSSERKGYTLALGAYEISDLNKTLEYLSPDFVKVNFTIDIIRLGTDSNFNQDLIFTKKSFFYTILEFIQSHSGPLGDIEGFVYLIPFKYRSEKPINITCIDKVHLKCDCIKGSIVNGIREHILYSLFLDQPPGHKFFK